MQDEAPGGDLTLPLIPLKNVVVFPRTIVNLTVGRSRSVQALNMAMSGDRHMVVVAQKTDSNDEPQPDDLYGVGTLVELRQVRRQPDTSLQVEVEAIGRVRILDILPTEACLTARVEEIDEIPGSGHEAESLKPQQQDPAGRPGARTRGPQQRLYVGLACCPPYFRCARAPAGSGDGRPLRPHKPHGGCSH